MANSALLDFAVIRNNKIFARYNRSKGDVIIQFVDEEKTIQAREGCFQMIHLFDCAMPLQWYTQSPDGRILHLIKNKERSAFVLKTRGTAGRTVVSPPLSRVEWKRLAEFTIPLLPPADFTKFLGFNPTNGEIVVVENTDVLAARDKEEILNPTKSEGEGEHPLQERTRYFINVEEVEDEKEKEEGEKETKTTQLQFNLLENPKKKGPNKIASLIREELKTDGDYLNLGPLALVDLSGEVPVALKLPILKLKE